ncbi:hypothetical protein [Bartonella sp. B39]
MYKTFLLSYTAATAITLFNIQFSAHAETLEVSGGKTVSVSDKTYEMIHAKNSGKIIGEHLTIVTNKDINQGINKTVYAVIAEGSNSAVGLLGGTTIKDNGSDTFLGLVAKDGATLQMIKGTITASSIGAFFSDSKSEKNNLKDVVTSIDNDNHPLSLGISAKNSTVALNNITITQATTGISAEDHSTVTVSGGSFNGKTGGVYAGNGSIITLNNNVTVASSNGNALHAYDKESKIIMTGRTAVVGRHWNEDGGALFAEEGRKIDATNVSLTTDGGRTSALAIGSDSVIELKVKTNIEKFQNGL